MPGTKDAQEAVASEITYDDLALLTKEFEDAELDILRAQHTRFAPLYTKRDVLISKIPHFWPLVIEQAPPELDQWIQPSDSKLFAECLTGLSVSRFGMDDPEGSPRSFSIAFTFSENEYFEDLILEKKFWHTTRDETATWTSEPVPIRWKKGKDLTEGLNESVWKLWSAKKNATGKAVYVHFPEYATVVKKVESIESDAALSFFTWFSYVSPIRYLTPGESDAVETNEKSNGTKDPKGILEDEYEDGKIDILSMIHPEGEDLAQLIAEDLWPNAIEYFTNASDNDDEEFSDMDDDLDTDDDSEGEEVDIRALVGKGKSKKSDASSNSPPPKKRKT